MHSKVKVTKKSEPGTDVPSSMVLPPSKHNVRMQAKQTKKKERKQDSKQARTHANEQSQTHVVDLGIVLTSFQIFTFDQVLDTFLHDTGLWIEKRELRQNLGKKLLMLECLTGLHDANNGGFDGNGAVFLNPFLVHGGIQGRHRDSDLAKVRREFLVRHERIGGIDLVASG
mmetsp:Transcript_26226/g.61500  ORF Transcript_26226/g.61500 Transcript_26226/m.61500 type:complete len:171 (-) Transcript_26226:2217-2729(-)